MALIPTDITRDELNDIASFDYYSGIKYAKDNNLIQGTDFSQVREGTHFIVCCGDVMVKIKETDFPDITRRELV